MPDDHGQRRHNNGTQPRDAGHPGRVVGVVTKMALLICEGNQQNCVGGCHTNTHDGAHQRWNVNRGTCDEQHPNNAAQRARKCR